MSKDLVIVGAGGLGREVKEIIDEQDWNLLGWVCNDHPVGEIINGIPVLGSDDYILNYKNELNVVIALGYSKPRRKLYEIYRQNKNVIFPSIISDRACVSKHLKYGMGCIIAQSVVITADVTIGNFCLVNISSTIGHDCVLEDFVSINPGVNVSGHVSIGEGSMLGTGSSVLQGISIGKNSMVGMSSSVIRNVKDNVSVYGIPAVRVY